MPPFPLSLTRPARKQRWVHVLAVAVTTACIGADLAQADPLFENAAEGVGSVAEILLPGETESGDDAAKVVDWIEKLPAWTDEPVAEDVDAFGEVVGEVFETEEFPLAIEEPIGEDPIQSSLEVDSEDGVKEEVKPLAEELTEERPIAVIEPIEDDYSISPPRPYISPFLPTDTACLSSRDGGLSVSAIGDWDGEGGSGLLDHAVCVNPFEELTIEFEWPWYPIGYEEGLEPVDEAIYAMRGSGAEGPITATPGPLPLAAALAGWSSARRLRRRCKDRP